MPGARHWNSQEALVMNLYLLRHADAHSLGERGVTTDEERPLSERGVLQAEQLAIGIKRMGMALDKVLTSPLRRSLQTAEVMCRKLARPGLEITVCNQLAPGQSTKKLAKLLMRVDADNLILVGHEPDLSRHTAWLIGSREARLEFSKGALAHVSCDAIPHKGAGTLLWLVTPQWLQALDGGT
jgi:phosphohistidine phosphatase